MLRLSLILALLTGLISGCGRSAPDPAPSRMAVEDWVIEPGVRAGALIRSSSVLDVERAYGAENVRDSSVALGEGEIESGTLLYPDDPLRRLEIFWADTDARRSPRRLVLRGERSRWMLPRDVSLGTSLGQLERINGRPFRLAGFGWDYAGVVTSWEGGTLDSLLHGVFVYLSPRIEDRAGSAYRRVLGDRDFESSNPDMRSLDPRVYQIFVDFAPPGAPGAGATAASGGR